MLGNLRLKELHRLVGLWAKEARPSERPNSRVPVGDLAARQLRAIVMACCLCMTNGQPPELDSSGNQELLVVRLAIVIVSIALWEAIKWVIRGLCGQICGRERR